MDLRSVTSYMNRSTHRSITREPRKVKQLLGSRSKLASLSPEMPIKLPSIYKNPQMYFTFYTKFDGKKAQNVNNQYGAAGKDLDVIQEVCIPQSSYGSRPSARKGMRV